MPLDNSAAVACLMVKVGLESSDVAELGLRFVSSCSPLRAQLRGSNKAGSLNEVAGMKQFRNEVRRSSGRLKTGHVF
jgi:hypothetical protein